MKKLYLFFIFISITSCSTLKSNSNFYATKQFAYSGISSDLNQWNFEININSKQDIKIHSITTLPYPIDGLFKHISNEIGLSGEYQYNKIIPKGNNILLGNIKKNIIQNQTIDSLIIKYEIDNKILTKTIKIKELKEINHK